MHKQSVVVDRRKSTERIGRDIETLAGPDYTGSHRSICGHAYIEACRRTVEYFTLALASIEFEVYTDPVGTFVARNVPRGEAAFGIGSHCDSNRNGGKYDGTLGVVTALEVCRLNHELDLGLPLQLMSLLEEEGSGFAEMLLGSRIMTQRVTETDLRQARAVDMDGASGTTPPTLDTSRRGGWSRFKGSTA